MFCHNCGTQVREGSPFCTHCGARQPEAPQAAGAAAPGSTTVYQPEQPAYQPPAAQGWQRPAQAGPPPGYSQQPAPQGYASQPYPHQPAHPPAQPYYGQPQGYPQAQPSYAQGQPYYGPSAARPSQGTMIASLLLVIGGALMAISPYLAWVRASALGRSETATFKDYIDDTDKNIGLLIIIFVIAAVAIIGGALRFFGRLDPALFRVWAAITGIAGVGEAIYQFIQYKQEKDDFPSGVSFNLTYGFYVLVISALLMLAAIAVDRATPRRV